MRWEEIRSKYPTRWVVIEAIKAHDFDEHRVIDEAAVINVFDDSMDAFREYRTLHKKSPDREFLYVSTTTPQLNIPNHRWVGVRR